MCALFLLALALRLRLLGTAPYGDEGAHYAMARTLGRLGGRFLWVGPETHASLLPLVVGRPLFALLHAPAAQFGFTAFRAFGAAVASLLPPLAYALVRFPGRRLPAAAAGLAVAVHPALVVWGSRVFPDPAMAALALGGLLAWTHGRPRLAAALLLGACLVKETAIPVLAAVALLALADPLRRREAAWLGGTLLASPLPLLAAYLAFPRLPGWGSGGNLPDALDVLLLSSWMLVPAALGALLPRTRPLSACLLGLLAFYAAFVAARGGQVNGWYAVLPACLAIAVAALLVDAGLRSAGGARLLAPVAAAALGFSLAAAVVGLDGGLAAALHPSNAHAEPGLAEALRFAGGEDRALLAAMRFQQGAAPARVMEVDLPWFWLVHPFAGRDGTAFAYTVTGGPDAGLARRIAGAGEASDLTWVQDWDTPFHRAFRQTYPDCKVFEAEGSTLAAYRLQDCPGRGARLAEAWR